MTKENKKQVKAAIRKMRRMTRREKFYHFYVETTDNSISNEEIAARYLSINGWNVDLKYGDDKPNTRTCNCTIYKLKNQTPKCEVCSKLKNEVN